MMMIRAVAVGLAVSLLGIGTGAYGQATKAKRPFAPEASASKSAGDTTKMTCAAARGMVMSKNAVVLHTGAEFDRYVSSPRYCGTQEHTHPALLRAKDNPLCFVGYYCDDPSDESGGAGEPGGGEAAGSEG
jgi:hypothetical protein